ncbi:cyclic peptide export ABC transporter [Thalassobaculum sp. OXR-137]|uniref:cyclic peptide export ABC transporter n=1 Tax=Thalassobaculum sp. OXR-137 TaxID=3100173 RepID=UPI002AC9AAAB|nr:cyclic peptide export ABC transporter [Thalassobaculum sp. OXR-137]WPZ32679.1 cyclic peptide export ABC transporter [Thalassobaculum sp. OXR-137]
MDLLKLIRRESKASWLGFAFLAAISGLANALILAVINLAASDAAAIDDDRRTYHLSIFLAVTGIYIVSQRSVMISSTREVEEMIHKIRMRLIEKIRTADLGPLERIGRSFIYASINKDTLTLSQAAQSLVVGAQSAILMLFTLLYIAWLSRIAFVVCVTFIGVASWLYMKNLRGLNADLQLAAAEENRLFDLLTDLLEGFKEVRMNAARSDALYADLAAISAHAAEKKKESQSGIARSFIFSQTMFYFLVAAMVFLVPQVGKIFHDLGSSYPEVVIQTATATLFLIGPVSFLVNFMSIFANANSAAENIERLDTTLSAAVSGSRDGPADPLGPDFEELELRGVSYRYSDPKADRPFVLGPLDLRVKRGEMIFVTGGNGSGKSTLIKLLAGLYYPAAGRIRIDRQDIGPETYEAYRNLISIVFADFHLFRRLYGIDHSDRDRVRALMERMEIQDKAQLIDGEFSTIELSTGQRKRLALVVSLLEDRPIYIFDEWAADQDPEFRRKFYREILPEMKRAGKTILAVTHDDHYFDVADRRIHMTEGRLVEMPTAGD